MELGYAARKKADLLVAEPCDGEVVAELGSATRFVFASSPGCVTLSVETEDRVGLRNFCLVAEPSTSGSATKQLPPGCVTLSSWVVQLRKSGGFIGCRTL